MNRGILAVFVLGAAFSACAQGEVGLSTGSMSTSSGTEGTTSHGSTTTSVSGTTSSTSSTSSTGGTSGTGLGGAGGMGGFGGGLGGFGGAPGPGCNNPIVAGDPSTQMGDNTGKPNDGDGSCQPGGGSDVVYAVDVSMDGTMDLTLTSTAALGVHVRDFDCSDPFSELACQDNGVGGMQKLSLAVYGGDTVYVFVDGHTAADHGAYTLDIKTHADVCGDGIIGPSETCDPPDNMTCGPNCQPLPEQICDDMIDNDGNGLTDCEDPACATDPSCPIDPTCSLAKKLQPNNLGTTVGATSIFAGSCTGSGSPEIVYDYTAPSDGMLHVDLFSMTDMGLYVRGKCDDGTTELACSDMGVGGDHETADVLLSSGQEIAVFVDSYDPMEAGPYTLTSAFTAFTEVEPNNSYVTANAYAAPFLAAINPMGDNDWVKVTVPGPASTLTAQVTDSGNGDCPNFVIDSEVQIYASDGVTSLAFNDDFGADLCSQATATGLAAGTYYVRAASSQASAPDDTFVYKLKITVQ